jgi:hypothetical protein
MNGDSASGLLSPAVRRRDPLSHPLAIAAAAALVGVAYLILAPQTADMAAHTYRTWLWREVGFAAWNAQWYGGHHMAGYSLLYPPLAVLLGTRLLGVLAGVAGAALFAGVARRLAPTPLAARVAAWLFMGGLMSNVVIGRMPFTLGVTLAVAAYVVASRSWIATAVLALLSVWASPVAGVFLALAAAGVLVAGPRTRRGWTTAAALLVPGVIGGAAMAVFFPEGGTDHFTPGTFWPQLALCVWGLAFVDPRRRAALAAAALYVAILVAAFAFPNALGQNALRPGVILGPVLLVLCARPGSWRFPFWLALVLTPIVGLTYLAWLPAVRAVEEAHGDPSTRAAYYAPVLAYLGAHARPGERVEIPLTRNHWESTYVARAYPLARGWHRQLDRKFNPLFYGRAPLNPAAYARWLDANAIRWVALPDAELDFSATREAALLRRGEPGLRRVARTAHWEIWEVAGAAPPVTGPARMTAAGADGFDLEATGPGTVVVRQHPTPYWTVVGGDGCILPDRGEVTRIEVRRAGRLQVRARFSALDVLGGGKRCSGAEDGVAPDAVATPPVEDRPGPG